MSVHVIYYKDGAKMMRPVLNRKEYLRLRGSAEQQRLVAAARNGDVSQKGKLVQMNYSCLPNDDGSLKGTTRMSTSVGMDIDFNAPEALSAEEAAQWLARQMAGVPERVLAVKDELGLLMLERSATKGYHLVFRRRRELTQEENLQWASQLLGVKYDDGAKDITRVFYTTTEKDLVYLDDKIFSQTISTPQAHPLPPQTHPHPLPRGGEIQNVQRVQNEQEEQKMQNVPSEKANQAPLPSGGDGGGFGGLEAGSLLAFDLCAQQAGLDPQAMDVWGEHNWHTNLMAVLSVGVGKLMSREQLKAVVAQRLPNYSQTKDCQTLIDYFYEKYSADKGFMNASLREINAKVQASTSLSEGGVNPDEDVNEVSDTAAEANASLLTLRSSLKRLPQGVRDSVDAVGPQLAMPAVTAICPCIGALATGVTLDVHGQKRGLNLIAYIAGDFASGKGQIDPVIDAWMSEVKALDVMYQHQEDEWRSRKLAAKNKKEQPEEVKLPVRCLTLNNTVANLAERLANTEGKHAFSFTPEADTVAQKWRSAMSDFSVMLRQSYDGSRYEREARSAEAVNVHIEHLLWNVTMCGTPDCLYRVVSNYTDGFQSRIAVARTPDNTFSPLEDKPFVLTQRQTERIQQVAHLLPLMQGEVVLPRLEAKGREWLERIRLETMMNDDKVRARQRFRVCVTAQRMTCCLMLCRVCEGLIQKHGLSGAETQLKQQPGLWREMLVKAQTPKMLEVYDAIADSLLENALFFFRDRIEAAFMGRDYAGYVNGERQKHGKNDSIYARLDPQFTFEQAMQHSVAVKGAGVTRNSVQQMLKNWSKQGLVVRSEDGRYRKLVINNA